LKRNLFGGLAVAGALTLWTSVAGFAQLSGPGAADAQTALDKVTGYAGCATGALRELSQLGTTTVQGDEAKGDLAELIADTTANIKEISADATSDITETLADYQAELKEAAGENEPSPSPDAFTKEVNDIATDTCANITRLMADVNAEVAELTAANSKDDQMKAADDPHADADKDAEQERD